MANTYEIVTAFAVIASIVCGLLFSFIALIFTITRSRLIWSTPHCAGRKGKCAYDLRGIKNLQEKTCPECGQDFSQKQSIYFVKTKTNWWLLATACIIPIIPIAIILSFFFAQTPAQPLQGPVLASGFGVMATSPNYSTEQIITALSSSDTFDHSLKQALTSYFSRTDLTQDELNQALDALQQYIEKDPDKFVSAQSDDAILKTLTTNPLVTDEQLLKFYWQYFKQTPSIKLEQRCFTDHRNATLLIGSHPDNFYSSNNNLQHLSHIKALRVNGHTIQQVQRPWSLRGKQKRFTATAYWSNNATRLEYYDIDHTIPPGKYNLEIDIEQALVRTMPQPSPQNNNSSQQLQTLPHASNFRNLKREDWPKDLIWHQNQTLNFTFTAYNNPAEAITFVQDESFGKQIQKELTIKSALIRSYRDKYRLTIEAERTQQYDAPPNSGMTNFEWDKIFKDPHTVSLQAFALIDGKEIPLNTQGGEKNSRSSTNDHYEYSSDYFVYGDIDQFPKNTNNIDIVFRGTLNHDYVRRDPNATHVWQGRIVKNTPIARWDLAGDGNTISSKQLWHKRIDHNTHIFEPPTFTEFISSYDTDAYFAWGLLVYFPTCLALLFLFILWLRGKNQKSNIHCKKCNHLLNNLNPEETPSCPNCNHTLQQKRSVKFSSNREPKKLASILTLLILPLLLAAIALFAQFQHRVEIIKAWQVQNQIQWDDAKLIAEIQTPTNPNFQPHQLWEEATKRLGNKQLSQSDIKQLCQLILKQVTTQISKNGGYSDLRTTRTFYCTLLDTQQADKEFLASLMQAIHPKPQLYRTELSSNHYHGSYIPIRIELKNQSHQRGYDFPIVWFAQDLTLNGQPISQIDEPNRRNWFTFQPPQDLPPGSYTLKFKAIGKCIKPGLNTGLGSNPWPQNILGLCYERTEDYELKINLTH